MPSAQVELRNTGFYLTGSRIPIDRIVSEFRNGENPETIRSHYPTLSLDQVSAAIAFYLAHKTEVEQAIQCRRRAEDAYTASHPASPAIRQKFDRMRRQTAPTSPGPPRTSSRTIR